MNTTMQRLLGWVGRNQLLLAGVAIVAGIVLLVWPWLPGIPTAPTSKAAVFQEEIEPFGLLEEPAPPTPTPSSGKPAAADSVIVYVSGAVRAPDVYRLPVDARIKDLVLAAGGFAEDADPDRINLAARLADSQHVYVPRQGESGPAPEEGGADESSAVAEQDGLVDINTADITDLDALPGIGQSFAERIIEYRTVNGPFESVEDLQKVKGIGPALFAKIAPLVTVGH
jgi:competence protein ComEA